MTQDRPFLGILLTIGFCVLIPMGDAMAKFLGAFYTLGTLLLVRFGVQTLVMSGVSLVINGLPRYARRVWWLAVVRAFWHVAGLWLIFASFRVLPLADAIAIAFVMPFILLLLGRFFLGETVGGRRLAACAVGFVGTLLVVQPSFATVGAKALLPLGAAVAFAIFILTTRRVAKDADPIALQAMSGFAALVLLAPLALFGPAAGWPDAGFALPATPNWTLLLSMGLIGSLSHLLMTWSLRLAPAATIAPIHYLEIPIAAIVGWLVFADFPNGLALTGIAITIAAGLYILCRERLTARAAASAQT